MEYFSLSRNVITKNPSKNYFMAKMSARSNFPLACEQRRKKWDGLLKPRAQAVYECLVKVLSEYRILKVSNDTFTEDDDGFCFSFGSKLDTMNAVLHLTCSTKPKEDRYAMVLGMIDPIAKQARPVFVEAMNLRGKI